MKHQKWRDVARTLKNRKGLEMNMIMALILILVLLAVLFAYYSQMDTESARLGTSAAEEIAKMTESSKIT